MSTKNLVFAALMVCTFKANSQVVVSSWNADNTLAPTYIDPLFVSSANSIITSGITGPAYPQGCPLGIPSDRGSAWGTWTFPPAPDMSKYIEVSVTFSTNTALTWFRVSTKRNFSGPQSWELRWSINSFASPLYTNTTTSENVCSSHSINLGPTAVTSGQNVSFRIYAYGGGTSSSGRITLDDIEIETAGSILPINLVNFWGEKDVRGNNIFWQTVSESNNSHFTVLRSENLSDWTEIGVVGGSGYSQKLVEYNFLDYNSPAGTSYYRLRQEDFNGTSEDFSWVIAMTRENTTIKTLYTVGEILRTETMSIVFDNSGRIESQMGSSHRLNRAGIFIVRDEQGVATRIIVGN